MINEFALALLFGVLLVTSFACTGLLALWAAASRLFWLLRVAVVLAVLSPLLFIPAYEPWSLFALQACTVAAGVIDLAVACGTASGRRQGRRRRRGQTGLSDPVLNPHPVGPDLPGGDAHTDTRPRGERTRRHRLRRGWQLRSAAFAAARPC